MQQISCSLLNNDVVCACHDVIQSIKQGKPTHKGVDRSRGRTTTLEELGRTFRFRRHFTYLVITGRVDYDDKEKQPH
eukprot:scaffold22905_cov158-Skeletonema_dohrnii-CCMP3373.AAC.1